jgi:PAS domain S-box-containing protein
MGKSDESGRPELRRRAEERLKERRPAQLPQADTLRLLHELEVHQIELELQNEELMAARHAVEDALERYAELFDFAPIGYAALDERGIIRAINRAGARPLGQDRGKLLGLPFAQLLASNEHDAYSRLLADTTDAGTKVSSELTLRAGKRPRAVVRATATRVTGRQLTYLLALEDITDLKEAEQAARGARELREADARKDEFLAMLSHELRNPLTPMISSLRLLDQTDLSDEANKQLTVIKRQVALLAHIVDDLLDVTRIKRGKVQLKRQVIDFGALVRGSVDDRRALFEQRGIDLECRADPGPFWIDADPTRIAQVMINLLSNAKKFTPRGGRVVVELRRTGAQLTLTISDTGAGISPDLIPRLFEPFIQGPQSLDRIVGGLGLGLAAVKGLVELHGGSVAIASRGTGQGAEVTLSLPLTEAPIVSERVSDETQSPPRRIVLIEDNQDIAEGLQAFLSGRGHDVRVAANGLSGIELVRAFLPDLVVCDIGLPGMDGYEVARAIRADPSTQAIQLVSLSGYARPEDLELAFKAGFNRHLAKPPDLDLLDRIIAQAPTARPEESPPGPSLH